MGRHKRTYWEKKEKINNISLIDKNKVTTNQKQAANIFNNYFINVAENLSNDLGGT